ncbi:MAG TPA: hypothetical protein DEP87_01905 [Candidatus Pacebacteria bacterium]|nr:hypothetical protein [Candidatus Paceibacterota bacterium]
MTKVEQFFENYKPISFANKSIIIKPDQILESVYYVTSGFVKQSAIGPNGEEFILNIFRPGSFFAISIAMHRRESYYVFESLTEVELVKAPTKDILRLLKTNPDLAYDLLSRITSGMNSLMTRMEVLIFGSANQKVAATIWQNAQRFGKKLADGTILIKLQLTHQQLASLTGLTRETVSIEMSKLKKQKILNYQGKSITILDSSRLKTLVPPTT